ncbi:MAG: COX15/CtaA family protein [Thermoplasmata archaeon]|nr:COX15/CtaA family protein [Thermoplasmata archaeon]
MRGHDLFRYTAIAAVIACYVTIILGGNVMASDSGLACPDWPSCHGTFAPPLSGGTGIEWTHRLAAFGLSVIIAFLAVLAVAFERSRPVLLRLTMLSLSTVVAQALLGGVVVVSNLYVAIVLLHLALATALFGMLLILVGLSNLRELPRRWLDWARHAAEEEPAVDPADPSPAGRPVPAPHSTAAIPVLGRRL